MGDKNFHELSYIYGSAMALLGSGIGSLFVIEEPSILVMNSVAGIIILFFGILMGVCE